MCWTGTAVAAAVDADDGVMLNVVVIVRQDPRVFVRDLDHQLGLWQRYYEIVVVAAGWQIAVVVDAGVDGSAVVVAEL